MTIQEEHDALTGLLTHPGWSLFTAHVKAEWGPVAYARRLKQGVTQASAKGENLEAAIKAIDLANNEVDLMQAWPTMRLKQIADTVAAERRESDVAYSRRGPNL